MKLMAVLLCGVVAACAGPAIRRAETTCIIKSGERECACPAYDLCIALEPAAFAEVFKVKGADGVRPTERQLAKLRRVAVNRNEPQRHELLSVIDACDIAGDRCILVKAVY